jgi:hypothetical protein
LARKENTTEGPTEDLIANPSGRDIQKSDAVPENTFGSKACSLCGVTFQTVEEQRGHIRSDLHGYNLKQRMRGAKAVSEEDFEKLVGGTAVLLLSHIAVLTLLRSG